MNIQSLYDPQSKFGGVLQKICDIVKKTEDATYIYRGESEHYPKVASSLYRAYLNLQVNNPAEVTEKSQKLIFCEAKKFFDENNLDYAAESMDFEIFAQLQHYGCPTNLIDFTTDYLIALFFACAPPDENDGRVICLKSVNKENGRFFYKSGKNGKCYEIKKASTMIKRAEIQKSRFITTDEGFIEIEDSDIITIPGFLKKKLRCYLKRYHDISTNNIYGDIHGFIQGLNIYPSGYKELHDGQVYENSARLEEDDEEKRRWYNKAIESYEQVLSSEEGPHFEANYALGEVYTKIKNLASAIQKYSEAIELDPNNATVYGNRGGAYRDIGKLDCAITDYLQAITLEPDNSYFYYELCGIFLEKRDLENFERYLDDFISLGKDLFSLKHFVNYAKKQDINLPEDLRKKLDAHVNN